MMRSRTIWNWKLKAYPVAALLLWALTADRQVAPTMNRGTEVIALDGHDASSAASAPISGIDNGTAVTCERHPMITHCFRLTQERK